MTARTPTLRRQIRTSFLAFAAAVSVLFAACSFVVAYAVEDQLFEDSIKEEVARQQAHWSNSGRLAEPLRDYVTIHRDAGSMPPDLRAQISLEQEAEEYAGEDGRHYHVVPFNLPGGGPAYAVAEVGSRLVVRPLRGELLLLVVVGALAMLVLAAILGYSLAERATAPLSRLVDAVSGTGLGYVPQISARDFPANEVGTLARTLEEMLERTRAFVERESRFTRDASHELRTPLAVISSSVELIAVRGEVPPPISKPLKRIADAARQMEQSVDLLLLLAREERSRSAGEDVLLLPLVERIVIAESMRFDAARFDVMVSIPANCRSRFNEAVATVILSNLIGNVFRHNETAALSIGVIGSDLVIADNGRGVPPAVLAALDGGSAPAGGGTRGLGLSIVARLCQVHSIPLHLDSSSSGTVAKVGLLRDAGEGTQ
jgi:signal transduction histidine kinase